MKWIISLVLIGASLALLAWASGGSAVGLLNLLNRLTPGDDGVEQVAKDVAYGPGPRQRLDVYRGSVGGAPRPVLIFLYGGGWNSGRRQDYRFAGEAYAAQGFLVVIPDYRLVPEVRFPGFVQDAASAVRWARDHAARFGGDPQRIVLAGHSAGAHIAMLLALDPEWLTWSGVDPRLVRAAAGLAGPYDFYPFTKEAAIEAFKGAADPRATQPVHFARRDAPALWLASGSEDMLVKPRNSRALAAAQQRFGTPVVYREYPGLDHKDVVMALARPFRRKAAVLSESAAFLKAHSGAPAH